MVDGKAMINIVYEDNHLLVVEKPVNMPVQADSSHDKDLLTLLKTYLKQKYHKPGNVYLGLIHRLDRPVGGLMVLAKTSKAASRLSEQIRNHQFQKTYLAVVQGPLKPVDTFIDKILKDPKTNQVTINDKGKSAELSYQCLATKGEFSLVQIALKTGRSHQIRIQFSSRKAPLYGDQKYNSHTPKDQIALFANQLEFIHPISKETLVFKLPMPKRYPFNLFNSNGLQK